METMLSPLATVVIYRFYRLRDTAVTPYFDELRVMSRLEIQIKGLHPTLRTFDEFTPIRLLQFIETIKDAVYALGKSEGTIARILAYFIKEDAKDAHEAQVSPGKAYYPLTASWPHVIYSLLKLFLALREVIEAVTAAKQIP